MRLTVLICVAFLLEHFYTRLYLAPRAAASRASERALRTMSICRWLLKLVSAQPVMGAPTTRPR
jgi:hypothetical protein